MAAFKHLSHEFLVVMGPGPDGYNDRTEFIVDPRFRDQFDIPQVGTFLVVVINGAAAAALSWES